MKARQLPGSYHYDNLEFSYFMRHADSDQPFMIGTVGGWGMLLSPVQAARLPGGMAGQPPPAGQSQVGVVTEL
jgi:hypothetical protein